MIRRKERKQERKRKIAQHCFRSWMDGILDNERVNVALVLFKREYGLIDWWFRLAELGSSIEYYIEKRIMIGI